MKVDLDKGLLKSLLIFGAIIEARDAYTGGHVWRVAQYAERIAKSSGLSEQQVFKAFLGGLIHDIGKVAVPDSILNKPGKLTDDEYEIMRAHPVTGRKILISHPLAPLVLDAIGHHHERVDGHGYPEKIPEANLSMPALIVSIADAFDAMTSTRPYRAGMEAAKAIYILQKNRSSQFDERFVDVLVGLFDTDKLNGVIGHSDESRPMLSCPACGPIITVPRHKEAGDTVHCHSCKAEFELHKDNDFFDIEFTKNKLLTATPEIDVEQIEAMAERAPKQIEL